MNENINKQLQNDDDIEVLTEDLLYQEAVLEYIEDNNDIDFLILDDTLPGEDIEKFINKIDNIKIVLLTQNSKKEIKNEKIYKKFTKSEISVEKNIEIIKKESNYIEELETEIKKLKILLENKKENTKIKNIKEITKNFIKKTQPIEEKSLNKIISIARK